MSNPLLGSFSPLRAGSLKGSWPASQSQTVFLIACKTLNTIHNTSDWYASKCTDENILLFLSTLPQAQKLCNSIQELRVTQSNCKQFRQQLQECHIHKTIAPCCLSKRIVQSPSLSEESSPLKLVHQRQKSVVKNSPLASLASTSSYFVLQNHKKQIIQSKQSRLTKLKRDNSGLKWKAAAEFLFPAELQNSAGIYTNSSILPTPNTELDFRYLSETQAAISYGLLNDQSNASSQIWAGMKVILLYFMEVPGTKRLSLQTW